MKNQNSNIKDQNDKSKCKNRKWFHQNEKTEINDFLFLIILFASSVFYFPAPSAFSCTAFMAAKGDSVFVGNNEDYFNPYTRMWFVPASGKEFGRVYFGVDHFFPQGGMNEKGLNGRGHAEFGQAADRFRNESRYI